LLLLLLLAELLLLQVPQGCRRLGRVGLLQFTCQINN
jgi:hypothetical protein